MNSPVVAKHLFQRKSMKSTNLYAEKRQQGEKKKSGLFVGTVVVTVSTVTIRLSEWSAECVHERCNNERVVCFV
jgi:hypothetical protein